MLSQANRETIDAVWRVGEIALMMFHDPELCSDVAGQITLSSQTALPHTDAFSIARPP